MKTFIETLQVILPSLIAGLSTFFITKYTCNKNVPLDKMEITYNRVYYPLYKLLYNNSFDKENIDPLILNISLYLNKYNKYVDLSTLKSFKLFCKYRDKKTYQNFKNNIYDKNTFLRRKLGYLEPSFLQLYTYSSDWEKFVLRILFESIIGYLFLFIFNYTKNINAIPTKVNLGIALIGLTFFAILVLEVIYQCCKFLYQKIKNKII